MGKVYVYTPSYVVGSDVYTVRLLVDSVSPLSFAPPASSTVFTSSSSSVRTKAIFVPVQLLI